MTRRRRSICGREHRQLASKAGVGGRTYGKVVVDPVKKKVEGEGPRLVGQVLLHVEEEAVEDVFQDLYADAISSESSCTAHAPLTVHKKFPARKNAVVLLTACHSSV